MKQARRRMSRINNIILKLPPETREKVLLLRDKYDILMKLDANTSREVARKAILLNYINGSGRKLFSDYSQNYLLKTIYYAKYVIKKSCFMIYSEQKIRCKKS